MSEEDYMIKKLHDALKELSDELSKKDAEIAKRDAEIGWLKDVITELRKRYDERSTEACEHPGCTDTDLIHICLCHDHINTDYPCVKCNRSPEAPEKEPNRVCWKCKYWQRDRPKKGSVGFNFCPMMGMPGASEGYTSAFETCSCWQPPEAPAREKKKPYHACTHHSSHSDCCRGDGGVEGYCPYKSFFASLCPHFSAWPDWGEYAAEVFVKPSKSSEETPVAPVNERSECVRVWGDDAPDPRMMINAIYDAMEKKRNKKPSKSSEETPVAPEIRKTCRTCRYRPDNSHCWDCSDFMSFRNWAPKPSKSEEGGK